MENMKKVGIKGNMCDVVKIDEYTRNKEFYLTSTTLIESDAFGDKQIFPIINQHDKKSYGIRIKPGSAFAYFNTECTDTEKDLYDPSKVIDLEEAASIKELMEKQEMIRSMEKDILTSPDNITQPDIGPEDEPAMKALKTAVSEKGIDLDTYSHRFGNNYNNDKRALLKDRISLQMLERMCNNLDMKATLTIEDASPDVPNPIGRQIVMELTKREDGD